MSEPVIIGISGKPGSAKNYFSFKIMQELRFQGYDTRKVRIPEALYAEVDQMIELWQEHAPAEVAMTQMDMSRDDLVQIHELLSTGDLGERHPVWGWNRKNETVRRLMDLIGTDIRRAQDPDYWLRRAFTGQGDIDFLLTTDIRFPNEAAYVRASGGLLIRADVNEHWGRATGRGVEDDHKYSSAVMNSPQESALDDYPDFYAHVRTGYFTPVTFTNNLLRHLGFRVRNFDPYKIR